MQRLGKWDRHAGLAHTPYETLDSCSDYTYAKVSAKGRMHAANTFGVLTDITRRGEPAEREAPTTCRWKYAIVRWVEEAGRADRYAQATIYELYWGVLTGRKKGVASARRAACGPWPRAFLRCVGGGAIGRIREASVSQMRALCGAASRTSGRREHAYQRQRSS